ncbi:MAG: KamA family radical SAM protein [Spirochaetales bacterium]|nr:KamA family radical SAM protein [Spirochaetales bacterium]
MLNLNNEERRLVKEGPRPPFKVTRHWLSLLNGQKDDPLRLQVVPSPMELLVDEKELTDPLGEDQHSPLPRLVHRYQDRVVVVMTGACALYCRHCFRRRLTGDDFRSISLNEMQNIAHWLGEHNEVKEVLLSGGDPLTMQDEELLERMDILRAVRPDLILRLATRMPVVNPDRITKSLARALGKRGSLWTVIQCNHPREMSSQTITALNRLQKQGIPILNQAVLLRGVNDDVTVLESLSRVLVAAGVKPYYLFQGDVAQGTGHFRVPLAQARALVNELRGRVSGLAMPNFAVDLPAGGGKVPLAPDYVLGEEGEGLWRMRSPDGQEGLYPDPSTKEK